VKEGIELLDFLFASGKYSGRNIKNHPKMIFLDLKIPKMDGFEVLNNIKNNPQTKNIPVVVFTSSKQDYVVEGAYNMYANSFILKPVESEKFEDTICYTARYWLEYNHVNHHKLVH
jgi:two-component system response regulator